MSLAQSAALRAPHTPSRMQMSIARASLIMIVTLAASRLLGWLRLSVIGAQFGGDAGELGAFWAAFRIPDTIFKLLVARALASAFIPVFAGYVARGNEGDGWRVAWRFRSRMLPRLIRCPLLQW